MPVKSVRKIIQINEEKCNGCGACIGSCAEGALAIVDGKAKLVRDQYCDGLAACLKECPQGALQIVQREAEEFDGKAVHDYLSEKKKTKDISPCACPSSAVKELAGRPTKETPFEFARTKPELTNWPVQLTLVPPGAKFLNGADVMLIAQCVPFAYAGLHRDFLLNHAVLTACPKLDDAEAHLNKLTEILKTSNLKSLTVVRMEVPCCSGLTNIAENAIARSGLNIQFKEIVIGINGEVK